MNIIREPPVEDEEDNLGFEPYKLKYVDNVVCYPDPNSYMYVVSPLCTILHYESNHIWLSMDSEWFKAVIHAVDSQFIQQQSTTMSSYLKSVYNFIPSLKLSPSFSPSLLCSRLNQYTEIYGDITPGAKVHVVLTANYSKGRLLWNVVKIKTKVEGKIRIRARTKEQDLEFLQECQLEGQRLSLIKI